MVIAFRRMLEAYRFVIELHSPSFLFAFALIFAALAALSLPRFTICVARALAFAA
jgi:hypothetical protein